MRAAQIRFSTEVTLATLAAGLAVLTLISREWVEVLFGVDPDQGSGALEWAIVGTLFAVSVALSFTARWDRKRHLAAAG